MPTLLKEHVVHSEIDSHQVIPLNSINDDEKLNESINNKDESKDNINSFINNQHRSYGVALGPEWIQKTHLREKINNQDIINRKGVLNIEYGQEVCGIYKNCLTNSSDNGDGNDNNKSNQNIEIKWQRILTRNQKNNESIQVIDDEYIIPNWSPSSIDANEQFPLYLHTTENKVIYLFILFFSL